MVGRPVTVAGEYDAGRQVLVSGKRQGGVDGFWVLTALRTPSGALVPVVRGFVPQAAPTPPSVLAPPTGPVALSGSLEPPETTPADAGAPRRPGRSRPRTPPTWSTSGAARSTTSCSTPPARAAPAGLVRSRPVPVPPPDTGGGLRLRNAAYAVQWWLFAAFALLLWWRMVRQDAVDTAMAADDRPGGRPDRPHKELSTS